MRLVVEGLTVDGQRLKDTEQPVNYSFEGELIFDYYAQCFKQHFVVRRSSLSVIWSSFFALEKHYKIFVVCQCVGLLNGFIRQSFVRAELVSACFN